MKRFFAKPAYAKSAIKAAIKSAMAAVVVLGGWASMLPAKAAPPTVTPSPGYDARLQESRTARTVYAPVVPDPKPVPLRRVKRARSH